MFGSVLIANRGEIACRIIRTGRELGLRTVAVYSAADADALHVEMADGAYAIGPADAAKSYLDADAVIAAARATGAEAVHPGYGFLAENADFAEACARAGLVFVGPPPAAIRAMGVKDDAKRRMEQAGVPVVPGYHGEDQSDATLIEAASGIGFPVLVKAAMGGGGKGMRRVDAAGDVADAIAGARREALSAFGDDRLLIERLIERPRHIEVQVFADDHGNAVHLFERDCSLQRRHQKVIEEAPAPGITPALRARMTDAALSAARAVDYRGAGTVEFIVDASAPLCDETPFYFLEMNTRLQVEHPVTELVTGLDLVEWQLRIAAGEPLPLAQDAIALDGHAVEARLYAEDPQNGFLPSTGRLHAFEAPADQPVRVDTGVRSGDEVTPYYDPMIAKLVCHGADRTTALNRLRDALLGTVVAGPETNQALLAQLLADDAFVSGDVDTGLIGRRLDGLLAEQRAADSALLDVGVVAAIERAAEKSTAASAPGPWTQADGFQLGPERRIEMDVDVNGEPMSVPVRWGEDGVVAEIAGQGAVDRSLDAHIFEDGDQILVVRRGRQMRVRLAEGAAATAEGDAAGGRLSAPMPGRITHVAAATGDPVGAGETILVLEAMKMEHVVRAPFAATVSEIHAAIGDQVEQGTLLAILERASGA